MHMRIAYERNDDMNVLVMTKKSDNYMLNSGL